jgi:hypothetical protein
VSKKAVDLEIASDDITWRVQLRAAEEVTGMQVQGTHNQTGEIQVELSLSGPMNRLDDLGGVLGRCRW